MYCLPPFFKPFQYALVLLFGVKLISSIQLSEKDHIERSTGYSEVFEYRLTATHSFFQWFLTNESMSSSMGLCQDNISQITDPFKHLVNISCFIDRLGFSTILSVRSLNKVFNNTNVSVRNDTTTFAFINLVVKDCPTFWDNGVTITNNIGFHYGEKAKFDCIHPKQLFHKTNVSFNTATKCTKHALWENQRYFICVAARLVGLNGPFLTGSTLNFSCNLEGSNYSAHSFYYRNGNLWSINSPVTWKENGANISCAYKIHEQLIYSFNHIILNVTYPPCNVTVQLDKQISPLHFVLSNQSINILCLSDANPIASCNWTLQGNLSVLIHKTGCNITTNFKSDVNLTCHACNPSCSNSTQLQIVSVPVDRKPHISVNMTSKNTINVVKGNFVTLECTVEKYADLKTKFSWYKDGIPVHHDPKYNLSILNTTSGGNYTCNTFDEFGNYSTPRIFVNVLYGPTWNESDLSCYENKSCIFTVYFNPTAKSINLTQTGGNMFENYTSEIQNQSNSYKFNKSLSMGSYILSVTNKVRTTRFQFKVVSSANLSGQSYLSWILGFGIPPAVIFPGILVYVGYKRKGKPKKSKKKNSQNQIAMSSDVANNVVANNGTNMQTTNEKEDRVNPLYAASGSHPDSLEDAYAQVDKHKKSEKEDKINPLYGATGQETLGENSETYASVNKLNKKKKKKADKGSKEKEVRVNPIYASSSTAIPETNEATYAVVDKKSKNKSEKEDRVNPLYGTTGKETVAKENTETYSTVNKIKKK